jgi:D-alanyl-D-alanine carboxypeptidase
MKMKWPLGFLVLLVGVTAQIPAAASSSTCGVDTRAAMVINVTTGKTLHEHNADTPIPPASITKVLTLYLVFEAMEEGRVHLKDQVFISHRSAGTGGSRMHILAGTEVSLEELIKGMAVDSGNDACVAAAEHVAGSEALFVAHMNRKAQELGMHNSHFINTNGLPARGQITTARDMAKLSLAYLRRFPESLRIHSLQTYTYNGVTQHNRNRLLGHCPGVDGIKTGWIAASGYNLLATAKRGDTRLLVVVLGAPNPAARLVETRKLLEVGFHKAAIGSSVIELADLTSYEDPYGPPPGKILPRGKPRKTGLTKKLRAGRTASSVASKEPARLSKNNPQRHMKAAASRQHQETTNVAHTTKSQQYKKARRANPPTSGKLPQTGVAKTASSQSSALSVQTGSVSKSGASSGSLKGPGKKPANAEPNPVFQKQSRVTPKEKAVDAKKKTKPQAKKHSSTST